MKLIIIAATFALAVLSPVVYAQSNITEKDKKEIKALNDKIEKEKNKLKEVETSKAGRNQVQRAEEVSAETKKLNDLKEKLAKKQDEIRQRSEK